MAACWFSILKMKKFHVFAHFSHSCGLFASRTKDFPGAMMQKMHNGSISVGKIVNKRLT